MSRLLVVLLFATFSVSVSLFAQNTVLLWPNGAPGALGNDASDKPSLKIYLPKKPPVAAVLIVPGGGYGKIVLNRIDPQVAQWFNRLGVAAFVLTYRVGMRYHYPIEFEDAQRAMRYVRSHAAEYNIPDDRIGVAGFSAGGHLASLLGTHFDSGNPASPDPIERAGDRPDFMILGYPVINDAGPASIRSFNYLLGDNPDPALLHRLFTNTQVTAQTPPAFIVLADDDPKVSPENGVSFFLGLLHAGVPAELHVYQKGGHGFGLTQPNNPGLSSWSRSLSDWLRERGILTPR